MQKKLLKNTEWSVLIVSFMLFLIGLVALFSATNTSEHEEFYKQIRWFLLSIPFLILIYSIDYNVILRFSGLFYLISIGLLHLKFQFSIMVHFFGPNLYLPPSMTTPGHFLPRLSSGRPLALHGHLLQVGLGSSLYSYPEGQPLLSTLLRVPFDIPADPALGEQRPSVPSPSNYD